MGKHSKTSITRSISTKKSVPMNKMEKADVSLQKKHLLEVESFKDDHGSDEYDDDDDDDDEDVDVDDDKGIDDIQEAGHGINKSNTKAKKVTEPTTKNKESALKKRKSDGNDVGGIDETFTTDQNDDNDNKEVVDDDAAIDKKKKKQDVKQSRKHKNKMNKDRKHHALPNKAGPDSGYGPSSSILYIGHLPKHLEEHALFHFIRQFGTIRRLKLVRSTKTGRSRGHAFVEMYDSDVATIVAETMAGHLVMGQRRLICHVVPSDKVHEGLLRAPQIVTQAVRQRLLPKNLHWSSRTSLDQCMEPVMRAAIAEKSKQDQKAWVTKRHVHRMVEITHELLRRQEHQLAKLQGKKKKVDDDNQKGDVDAANEPDSHDPEMREYWDHLETYQQQMKQENQHLEETFVKALLSESEKRETDRVVAARETKDDEVAVESGKAKVSETKKDKSIPTKSGLVIKSKPEAGAIQHLEKKASQSNKSKDESEVQVEVKSNKVDKQRPRGDSETSIGSESARQDPPRPTVNEAKETALPPPKEESQIKKRRKVSVGSSEGKEQSLKDHNQGDETQQSKGGSTSKQGSDEKGKSHKDTLLAAPTTSESNPPRSKSESRKGHKKAKSNNAEKQRSRGDSETSMGSKSSRQESPPKPPVNEAKETVLSPLKEKSHSKKQRKDSVGSSEGKEHSQKDHKEGDETQSSILKGSQAGSSLKLRSDEKRKSLKNALPAASTTSKSNSPRSKPESHKDSTASLLVGQDIVDSHESNKPTTPSIAATVTAVVDARSDSSKNKKKKDSTSSKGDGHVVGGSAPVKESKTPTKPAAVITTIDQRKNVTSTAPDVGDTFDQPSKAVDQVKKRRRSQDEAEEEHGAGKRQLDATRDDEPAITTKEVHSETKKSHKKKNKKRRKSAP